MMMYCTTLTFLCKKVSEAGGLGIMIKELSCPKNVQEEGKKRVAAAARFFALSILYYISSLCLWEDETMELK